MYLETFHAALFVVFYYVANELAKQQRKNFGESITSAIRYAKKLVSKRERGVEWVGNKTEFTLSVG